MFLWKARSVYHYLMTSAVLAQLTLVFRSKCRMDEQFSEVWSASYQKKHFTKYESERLYYINILLNHSVTLWFKLKLMSSKRQLSF